MNLCRACGEDFGSVNAFDAHRVGTHAYTSTGGLTMTPPRDDGRRCLAVWEMETRGFVRNAREAWSLSRDLERARGRLRRTPDGEEASPPDRETFR
jgi:hypothetical protein